MSDRFYTPKKQILLTGAGFSKPFGGYLAGEMWAVLFNKLNMESTKNVRALLRGEMDYELVYDSVLSGSFADVERKGFTDALVEAYGALDRSIQSCVGNKPALQSPLRAFLSLFKGEDRRRGFIFTLNQDLLLERFYRPQNTLFIPALGQHPDWFTGRMDRNTSVEVDMPPPDRLKHFQDNFWKKQLGLGDSVYVKLHGAYGWRSSRIRNAMVIGHDKAGTIAKEPLLDWYQALFKEVLNYGDQILVVVGYRFMDEHINNIIADAAKTNLQLHVISPMQPKDFEAHLSSRSMIAGNKPVPRGKEMWQMLSGYHCTSAEQLFPHNASALPEDFMTSIEIQNLP
jgi:hypothetical protein